MAAEVSASLLGDAGSSGHGKRKVCKQRPSHYEGSAASVTSLPLRRVGEREWTLLVPPVVLCADVGGTPPLRAEPMAGRRGCGRGRGLSAQVVRLERNQHKVKSKMCSQIMYLQKPQ